MAPPTIAVHKIPDPWAVYWPIPCMARVNMVGNMMELNRPMLRMDQKATPPLEIMATVNSITLIMPYVASRFPGLINRSR